MTALSSSCRPGDASEWLTTREASKLVGVSVATLRRWCDAGEVRAFKTPGGHRRFERSAVLGLAGERPLDTGVARQGETRIRIIRLYRSELRRADHELPVLLRFPEHARQQLRLHGGQMAGALLDAIDAHDGEREAALASAAESATACALIARHHGLQLTETLGLFTRFRGPFLRHIGAIVGGQGGRATDATAVLVAASDALDRLLPAVIEAYTS